MTPSEIRLRYSGRNFSTVHILQFFADSHLNPDVNEQVTSHIQLLAFTMADRLPDGPELSAGLRKLLEAKDCFVRQYIIL